MTIHPTSVDNIPPENEGPEGEPPI